MATEVITTTDKEARDRMFEDLRRNGNELERQVVKFSSNEPILGEDGKQLIEVVCYSSLVKGGHLRFGKDQYRPQYRSNWSVAYPNGFDFNG